MSEYMGDLTGILGASASNRTPEHNTRKTSVDMDMTDFLTLMVAQLQNQSLDQTADTSQMLNQMVQMQMITALTNMTEASVMSYASSLVGKEVTVVTYDGSKAKESVIEVMGTGTYGGEQVIFSKEGDMYRLKEIMTVGRMPEKKTEEDKADKPVENTPETPEGETPADRPVESTQEGEEAEPAESEEPKAQGVEASGGATEGED